MGKIRSAKIEYVTVQLCGQKMRVPMGIYTPIQLEMLPANARVRITLPHQSDSQYSSSYTLFIHMYFDRELMREHQEIFNQLFGELRKTFGVKERPSGEVHVEQILLKLPLSKADKRTLKSLEDAYARAIQILSKY